MDEYVGHLKRVLETLAHHSLYAKRFKCLFEVAEADYLGHIVTRDRKFIIGYGLIAAPLTSVSQRWV